MCTRDRDGGIEVEKDQEEGRSWNKEQPGRKVPEGVAESRRRRGLGNRSEGVRRDIILASAALSSALCLYSQDSHRGRDRLTCRRSAKMLKDKRG